MQVKMKVPVTGLTQLCLLDFIDDINIGDKVSLFTADDISLQVRNGALSLKNFMAQQLHDTLYVAVHDKAAHAVGWIPVGLMNSTASLLALKEAMLEDEEIMPTGTVHAINHYAIHDPSSSSRFVISLDINFDANGTPIDPETVAPIVLPTYEGSLMKKMLDVNKEAIADGAFLEAGRIATTEVTKRVAPKLPMMARGYVDSPFGRLVVANLAVLGIEQFRGDDAKLKRLGLAMTTAAYQEVMQLIDVEGMIDDLLDSSAVRRALRKADDEDDPEGGEAAERPRKSKK